MSRISPRPALIRARQPGRGVVVISQVEVGDGEGMAYRVGGVDTPRPARSAGGCGVEARISLVKHCWGSLDRLPTQATLLPRIVRGRPSP